MRPRTTSPNSPSLHTTQWNASCGPTEALVPRTKKSRRTKTRTSSGAKFDVAGLRRALAKASGVPKISRPAIAKLVGAHPNSIALWESGKLVGPKYLEKLRALEARVRQGGNVGLPPAAKRGGPKAEKAAGKRPVGRPKMAVTASKRGGKFDVKALRSRLGLSRNALAKLLGVSAGSVFNWERGKSITTGNVEKLRSLQSRAESGQMKLPERRKPGRPKKAASQSAVRGRGRSARIDGSAPIVYANVASLVRRGDETLVRFGLRVPGGGARAVAEVVMPADVFASLTP